jgi:hypothetical protein
MATSPCHHCSTLAEREIIVLRIPPPGLPARLLDQPDWSRLPYLYLYCCEECVDEHWANEHRKVSS